MVEIVDKVAIKYQDGSPVAIPSQLIHTTEGGVRFLQFQASHSAICRLVCGHNDFWKQCKNPSLSGSKNYGILREKQEQAMMAALQVEEEDDKKDQIFTDNSKKKTRPKICNGPETLVINVNGCNVVILAPGSWKQQDVVVQLDETMLEAVIAFMAEDCESCLASDGKRTYQKTNKRQRVDDQPEG